MQQIGMIRLECLMSRGGIYFSSGFKFSGEIDIENLKTSFESIVDQIGKFKYLLNYETQDNCSWSHFSPGSKRFLIIESDDIDDAFRDFCADSVSILDEAGRFPVVLALICNKAPEKKNEFTIAILSDHTYLDNRSSTILFHKIIEHYNALTAGDLKLAQSIVESAGKLHTASAAKVIDQLTDESVDHDANASVLANYPIVDDGGYNISITDIPACIESYRQERVKPEIQYFDQKQIIDECRQIFPEVTRNSISCAVLAKGMYLLNTKTRGIADEHQITMKMVIDLLSPELREQYSGNYIGFLPVTVSGHKPIAEIAKEVDDRVKEIKTSRQDLTAFSLVEGAVEQALVGTADEGMSLIVTNWNNYFFLESEQYLSGCQSLDHFSGVNVDPKCIVGAALINKPVAVINITLDEKLCLSFFPSLRSQQENNDLMNQVKEIFNHYNLN